MVDCMPRAHRTRIGLLLVGVLCAAIAVAAYARLGWWRMEDTCSANPLGARTVHEVSYSWSWKPLGFTCSYTGGERNGETRTSLWF
jgi:hypothetical protein